MSIKSNSKEQAQSRDDMGDAVPTLDLVVREIADAMAQRPDRGEIATYIPELARVDPKSFGLAVIDAEGNVAAAGDSETPFSIQSISKVFTLTLALGNAGGRLWGRVGREPSGSAFNSIVQLEFARQDADQGVRQLPDAETASFVGLRRRKARRCLRRRCPPSAQVACFLRRH
jgi:hypothetical protein